MDFVVSVGLDAGMASVNSSKIARMSALDDLAGPGHFFGDERRSVRAQPL